VIEFLRGHDPRRPFFVYLAPPVPHDPRLAPPEFMAMYDAARLTLSKNFMPEHPSTTASSASATSSWLRFPARPR